MSVPYSNSYLSNKKLIFLFLFFTIIFSPFFFQKWRIKLTPLFAVSGDEPHYLVMANSLAKDFDLEVSNNYRERQYGELLKNYELDHHTYFIHESKRIPWEDVYEVSKSNSGVLFVKKETYRELDTENLIEVPIHPPGYPLLLAAFFYPFLNNGAVYSESIILFFQLLFFSISVLYAYKTFSVKPGSFLFVFLALSYPVWTLNASFYTEGIIGSLLLLSFCHLQNKKTILFALDLFLIIFIKEIYIPAAFFLSALFFMENKFRLKHLPVIILPALSLLIYFIKNFLLFSNPFHTYIPYSVNNNILNAVYELLFSSHKGILVFSPHLIFLPAALIKYTGQYRLRGAVLAAVTFIIFTVTIFHSSWSGGPSFSYRTFAPILFFSFPLIYLYIHDKKIARYFFMALMILSFSNMFFAVTNLGSSYASPPLINLFNFHDSRLAERFF